MKSLIASAIVFTFIVSGLLAQDISGTWQGTLDTGVAKVRLALRIHNTSNGLSGTLLNIDQTPDWGAGTPLESISISDRTLRIKISPDITFQGTLNADMKSVDGSWIQGRTVPLKFEHAKPETEWQDTSSHNTRFVTVNGNVQLEVLDWGGAGRPVVLLAGLGNTAHIFDALAPKLSGAFHVYGITRRGFGASGSPASGYGADRLGDDVLEVIDTLRLSKPILVGHSIAGQELSSIGSRHPDRVAGLVYLDAAYSYAYYDAAVGDGDTPVPADVATMSPIDRAILEGRQKYSRIQCPVLAIYALAEGNRAAGEAQANAFEKGVPSARVIRLPMARHFFFLTNETLALNQINSFIARIP